MNGVRPAALTAVAGLVAAGVMAFEIGLLRLLLVASWHHFAFVVISIALLGFGASGTVLALLRKRLLPAAVPVLAVLIVFAAAAMPACTALAQSVPVESRLLPALLWPALVRWVCYWLLLAVPLFLGACAIGLTVMLAGPGVATVYAGNLLGSAAGSLLAPVAMAYFAPGWLPHLSGGIVLLALPFAVSPGTRGGGASLLAAAALAASAGGLGPIRVRLDPYKYGAYVQQLADQRQADLQFRAIGPRAVVEVWTGEAFHELPFLSGGETPPKIAVLLRDGHLAGSVLQISGPDEASVLEQRVTACAFDVLAPRPRVLLLGEAGTLGAWLAARHGATAIDMVQADRGVFDALAHLGPGGGGAILEWPAVRAIAADPRQFIDSTTERYDLIQLAALESLPAGSGGVAGLAQDDLMTVEGVRACLGRLQPGGLLAVTRGVQDPPRDNLKIFATFMAALRQSGAARPEQHLVVVRDFLAVCTLARSSPWTAQEGEALRAMCRRRGLTPVWFPGISPQELNRPDVFEAAPDGVGDWYNYALRQLGDEAAGRSFIERWPFHISPATDDRPFFRDFCKLASFGRLRAAYGELWPTRGELAFVFVLFVIAVLAVAGAALTLAPLTLAAQRPGRSAAPGGANSGGAGRRFGERAAVSRRWTIAYFAAVGAGYMLLEMTLLARLTRWVGDPVIAAAVTIAGFLLFSGCGALCVPRGGPRIGRWWPWTAAALLVSGWTEVMFVSRAAPVVASWPMLLRCAAALAAVAPLAFLMGFPMPAALQRLESRRPELIPWAWGLNGCAAVLAAPVAAALAMTWGLTFTGLAGVACYVLPAWLLSRERE
jgi:hypothetical protein